MVTVDGTSASGPIMAGVVSLLNEARLNAGKSSLGLLNPMFYKVCVVVFPLGFTGCGDGCVRDQVAATLPGAFKDVVVGSNFDGDLESRGSPYATFCPYGFVASPGWDPVTGLGSPNYAILKDYVLSLP
jgi:tripeptidyl-peptidase I